MITRTYGATFLVPGLDRSLLARLGTDIIARSSGSETRASSTSYLVPALVRSLLSSGYVLPEPAGKSYLATGLTRDSLTR